jgi:glycosyltransferase involved in cell wall biosynthesis
MGAPLTAVQARTIATLANVDVLESSFAVEWMPSPWREVDAASEWLLGIAQRVRPDVVHVNGYAHAALPFGVPIVCVTHACVCSWAWAVRGVEAGPEWNEYRRRVARGLLAADDVVGPTAAILRAVHDAHGLPLRGRVIPNGRGGGAWRPAEKEAFVLAMGPLWDEAKGLGALVACAERVRWPIRVAGPTRAPGARGERVHAGGLELLGELTPEELATSMSRASIFALPARYEPFGLSVLDAALAGCALVVGDLETLREVWGDTAVYVPPGDPDALGFTLEALARDPLRRGVLAAAARARAAQLSAPRMGRAYRALYDVLLADAAGRKEVCA